MKKCIHCGRELPDEASFCPYCETVQGDVVQERPPKRIRKRTVIQACCLIFLALLLTHTMTGPKTVDAKGPELVYGDYRLILTFSPPDDPEELPQPQDHSGGSLTAVDGAAVPSLLYAASKDSEDNRSEEFRELIESVEVTPVPRDNAEPMRSHEIRQDARVPEAMLMCDISYSTECGTNDICWTLHMKNGDTLKLQHNFTCIELPSAVYSPEDTPLDTIEDLQELLARIDAELPPDIPVYIFLPPVVYEGGLTLENRTCALIGSDEEDSKPVFTGTITVKAAGPEKERIEGIRFEGEGPGIAAYVSTMASSCTFSGMETGIAVCDGGAFDPHRCLFENCGTGILYDVNDSPYTISFELDSCEFRNNRTGLYLKAFANGYAAVFNGCVFAGNGTDIQNDTEVPVDTSGAIFE